MSITKKYKRYKFYLRDSFLTYWTRPKKSNDVTFNVEARHLGFKVAIVIQGKLLLKDNFTLESVKIYRRKYPDVAVVVSTWADEDSGSIAALEHAGAVVVQSEIPNPLTGFCNNNLQRISSLNGILKARELGADYVLKCRTDQRFYENDIFNYMIKLQKLFPLRIKCSAEERIIICSVGTFSTRLYNWSDMFTFGRISDVLRYYSCPNDDRDHNKELIAKDLLDYCKQRPGEIYFSTHYIEALGFNLKWTFEDSCFYMKELTIIIDNEAIDLFWKKYTKREYVWRRYEDVALKQVTFKDWLSYQE